MDKSWIPVRIAAAKQASPISDDVASAVADELQGAMSERALRPAELSAAARRLLETAIPSPPKEPAK